MNQKVEALIAAANCAGGKDNVTVVLLQVPGQEGTEQEVTEEENEFVDDRVVVTESEQQPTHLDKRILWGAILLALVLILGTILANWWM